MLLIERGFGRVVVSGFVLPAVFGSPLEEGREAERVLGAISGRRSVCCQQNQESVCGSRIALDGTARFG